MSWSSYIMLYKKQSLALKTEKIYLVIDSYIEKQLKKEFQLKCQVCHQQSI